MAYVVTVGESETLFSAHLDTAESTEGKHVIVYTKGVATSDGNSIIGADDGAGVWLLTEMIEAGVPGTYVFTVGEERGGVGAKYLAKNHAKFLGKFKRAIAFDRRGVDSVITHQWSGRCCSDEFADDLGDRLNLGLGDDGFYCPDDTGVYTDTAEYVDLIDNCTNISCGYQSEHTHKESLDVWFLIKLREACINLEWESLNATPCPYEPPPVYTMSSYKGFSVKRSPRKEVTTDNIYDLDYDAMEEWVYNTDPSEVAGVIMDLLWGTQADRKESQAIDDLDYADERLPVGMW